jgi:hypothetical protein
MWLGLIWGVTLCRESRLVGRVVGHRPLPFTVARCYLYAHAPEWDGNAIEPQRSGLGWAGFLDGG